MPLYFLPRMYSTSMMYMHTPVLFSQMRAGSGGVALHRWWASPRTEEPRPLTPWRTPWQLVCNLTGEQTLAINVPVSLVRRRLLLCPCLISSQLHPVTFERSARGPRCRFSVHPGPWPSTTRICTFRHPAENHLTLVVARPVCALFNGVTAGGRLLERQLASSGDTNQDTNHSIGGCDFV